MRLEEIRAVGSKAAKTLHQNGYRYAEDVAYGFGPDICELEGIDSNIYLNAQSLVAEQSNLSPEKTLENNYYWCLQCGKRESLGSDDSTRFKNEGGYVAHVNRREHP